MFAIRFDFLDQGDSFYAGMYKGGLGWAPTVKTAMFFDTAEDAARTLENGYGSSAQYGSVILLGEELSK